MKVGDLLKEASFPAFSMERWRELAEKALGGASLEEAIVSRTDDGIRIDPLSLRVPDARPVAMRVNPAASWAVTQRIDDPDPARANRQALEDVEQGATGLALVFEGAPNAFGYGLPARPEALAVALHNVPLNRISLRIDAHPVSRASVDWLFVLLGKRRVDPTRLGISFGIDPAAIFGGTGNLKMSIEALKASMPPSLAHFFALGLPGILLEGDGRVFHNAGATEAQELGIAVASAVSHLRMFEEARQPLVYAAPHIGFSLAVDQDHFVSMAKLRALRLIWARVQEACSIPPATVSVHVEGSYRMMTEKDPETNILRNTIAAFAAAAGGADSIAILPHTIAHGLPDASARRIARNTQLILAQESHIGFAADPAAGSGSVEALTGSLCEAAWEEFLRIEAEGGVLDSLAAGKIQSRVATARAARAAAYESGSRQIVGTTLYPLVSERHVSVLPASRRALSQDGGVAFCERLAPMRIDETIAVQR
ncbi:methylmalonyl-CoA mutase family protein [Mesorhizobium sp. BAC0120]|uniref:methylmalonyl-CoA mutase family protein n=1 Tax=Mesorhizobium sp. BAC0120 TaxID=3090670 RepID=UPI00298D4162|nr:methylmalonyl-CoA mutase family protein [Mesorhizobium sp. BAC0120]MDW6021047.1 methylmalonyl-CoA mutase family protein [Mesorhizobium sp. BAC0120]